MCGTFPNARLNLTIDYVPSLHIHSFYNNHKFHSLIHPEMWDSNPFICNDKWWIMFASLHEASTLMKWSHYAQYQWKKSLDHSFQFLEKQITKHDNHKFVQARCLLRWPIIDYLINSWEIQASHFLLIGPGPLYDKFQLG